MVVVVWWSSRPGRRAIMNETVKSALYQNILKEIDVRPSVYPQAQAHLGSAAGPWSQTHQQVHLWTAQEKTSQSPDLNPAEMLWHDLKQSIHAQKPSNVTELNTSAKKSGPKSCERLIGVITNAWLQLLLQRVPQPVIRFIASLFCVY